MDWPELPAELGALTDEELQALHDEFQNGGRDLLEAAKNRDAEVLGERTQEDVDTELTSAAEALAKIRAEQDTRAEAEKEFEASLQSHAEVFGNDDSEEADTDGDEGDTQDDDEPAAEAEKVTETETEKTTETEKAQTASASRKRSPLPLAAKRHRVEAPDMDASGFRSQVRSEPIGISYGDQIRSRDMMGELLNQAIKRNMVSPGGSLVVASATIPFDDSRVLRKREEESVRRIVELQRSLQEHPEALTASGALCAPLEPVYDIFGVSTARRPVRDALPSFRASRGGVITRAAPTMGVYDEAVGIITADENVDGSTNVKNCMRLICPDPETIEVASIYRCTEADNLASRSDPELMAAVDELVRAEYARLAETFLLNGIKDGSTAVTGDAGGDGGATFNVLGDVLKMAAAYRSRHRMDPNAVLTALFPAWVADLLALDVGRAASYGRTLTRTEVNGWLRQQGIAPSYYLDSSTGGGAIFGAQSAGAILDFPATMEWFLFAPGTWLHLDSGTLDLGVVRDSILNSTNDFQVFAEGWENVAFVGVESDVITSAVCPSGTFSAGIDNKAVC